MGTTQKILVALLLVFSGQALAVCHVDLDLDKDLTTQCPGVQKNLGRVNEALLSIYRSTEVQSNAEHCEKFVDLLQAVCQKQGVMTGYFSSSIDATKDNIKIFSVRKSTDLRLNPTPPTKRYLYGAYEFTNFGFGEGAACSLSSRAALTLTPTCGAVTTCTPTNGLGYLPKAGHSFEMGFDSTGKSVAFETLNGVRTGTVLLPQGIPYYPTVQTSIFRGTCSETDVENKNQLYYNRLYVAISPRGDLRADKPLTRPQLCSDGSISCTNFNVPLLRQNSTDLLNTVTRKTRIASAEDMGFCTPTVFSMLLQGLKNGDNSFFGRNFSAIDVRDPVDEYLAKNYSGGTYKAGQILGTDWWTGGTAPNEDIELYKMGVHAADIGTVDFHMGTKLGYTTQNFINFINKFSGLIKLGVGWDTLESGVTSLGINSNHSILVAGHSGGYLRVLDPWGRVYLTSLYMKTQDVMYMEILPRFFEKYHLSQYDPRVFWWWNDQGLRSYSFGVPLKVGYVIPLHRAQAAEVRPNGWVTQLQMVEMLQNQEVVKLHHFIGRPIPHLQHVSGEAGFAYSGPDGQVQIAPFSEVAVASQPKGTYFEAMYAENAMDMLYGYGQRVRASWALINTRSPTQAEMDRALSAVRNSDNWTGVIDETFAADPANLSASATSVDPLPEYIPRTQIAPTGVTLSSPNYFTASGGRLDIFLKVGEPVKSLIPKVTGSTDIYFYILPQLPPGLTYSRTTGEISGTPTSLSKTATYTLIAANSAGSAKTNFRLGVVSKYPPLAGNYNINGVRDVTIALNKEFGPLLPSVRVMGGDIANKFSLSFGSLPPGLSLDSATGALRGTPTTLRNRVLVSVNADNEGGGVTLDHFWISVVTSPPPAPTSLQYPGFASNYPANSFYYRLFAPEYQGGRPKFFQVTPALPPGVSLNSQSGEIQFSSPQVPTASQTYTITGSNELGFVKTSLSFAITSGVPAPQDLNSGVSLSYAAPSIGFYFKVGDVVKLRPRISNASFVPTSFTIFPDLPEGFQFNRQTGEVSGVPVMTIPRAFYTVYAHNKDGSVRSGFGLAVSTHYPTRGLIYNHNGLTDIVLGVNAPFSGISPRYEPLLGDPPTSYRLSGMLPPGMSFNSSTGAISGTPTAAVARRSYSITPTNAGGDGETVIFYLTVSASPEAAPTSIQYTAPTEFIEGRAMGFVAPSFTGGKPRLFTISPALPSGIQISAATGSIWGTPATSFPLTTYTITAANSGGKVSTNLAFGIKAASPLTALSYPNLGPVVFIGQNISHSPTVSGGPASSYTISSPLPPGMAFSTSSGLISGIPTAVSPRLSYTVTAFGKLNSISSVIQLEVSDAKPITAFSYVLPKTQFLVGEALSLSPTIVGTPTNKYWINTSVGSALPPGLNLNLTTGVISGAATEIRPLSTYGVCTNSAQGSTVCTNLALQIGVPPQKPTSLSYSWPRWPTVGVAITPLLPTVTGPSATKFRVSPPLPNGLFLDEPTGRIYGTPTVAAPATAYTFYAENSAGFASFVYTLGVDSAPPPNPPQCRYTEPSGVYLGKNISFVGSVLPDCHSGNRSNLVFTAPVDFPAGLSVRAQTGEIIGIPTRAVPRTLFKIGVKSDGGTSTADIYLTVLTDPQCRYTEPSAIYIGDSYSFPILPNCHSGITTNLRFAPPVDFPAGLSLNTLTGEITGKPTRILPRTLFKIGVTSDGGTATADIYLTVWASPPQCRYTESTQIFRANSALTPHRPDCHSGNRTNLRFTAPVGFPSGLSVNAQTGEITGTPTTSFPRTLFKINVSSDGGNATADVYLQVYSSL